MMMKWTRAMDIGSEVDSVCGMDGNKMDSMGV